MLAFSGFLSGDLIHFISFVFNIQKLIFIKKNAQRFFGFHNNELPIYPTFRITRKLNSLCSWILMFIYVFYDRNRSHSLFGTQYSSDNAGDGPLAPLRSIYSSNSVTSRPTTRRSAAANPSVLASIHEVVREQIEDDHSQISDIIDSQPAEEIQNSQTAPVPNVQNVPNVPVVNVAIPPDVLVIDFTKKLLDLEFDQYGHLESIVDSMSFIPEKFVPKVRSVFIDHMKKVKDNPHTLLHWKKFMLLPTVLFTIEPQSTNGRKKDLAKRIELIETDNWDPFTLDYFKKRSAFVKDPNPSSEAAKRKSRLNKRINQLAKAGELGEIMKVISREDTSTLSADEIATLLKAKHPEKNPETDSLVSFDDALAINNVRSTESLRNLLNINGNLVR